MRKFLTCLLGCAMFAPLFGQVKLRYTCYGDANECEVAREMLDKFEAKNNNIKIKIDKIAYTAILESLPIQLAASEGPDMARVTDLGGLNKYYLDLSPYVNKKYWEDNFGNSLNWVRSDPTDKGIYGWMTQLTVTGPYVNRTLFEQAGVALPKQRLLGMIGLKPRMKLKTNLGFMQL